jgi:hypothetical protein
VPRTVRSVVSRPGGIRELSEVASTSGAGHTSTTLVQLQGDAFIDEWENQGVRVHGLKADGRAWFKILTAPPTNPVEGDLWIERQALNNTVVRFHNGVTIVTLMGTEAPGFSLVTQEAIIIGHALAADIAGAAYAAATVTGNRHRCIGLAAEELAGPGTLQVLVEGDVLVMPDWSLVAGSALLVPGTRYFLSDTPGRYTNDPTGLEVAAPIGIAVDPDRLQINISSPVRLS